MEYEKVLLQFADWFAFLRQTQTELATRLEAQKTKGAKGTTTEPPPATLNTPPIPVALTTAAVTAPAVREPNSPPALPVPVGVVVAAVVPTPLPTNPPVTSVPSATALDPTGAADYLAIAFGGEDTSLPEPAPVVATPAQVAQPQPTLVEQPMADKPKEEEQWYL